MIDSHNSSSKYVFRSRERKSIWNKDFNHCQKLFAQMLNADMKMNSIHLVREFH